MTTEAQRIARAANGARSRGPVTTEGKAISRLNAMKYGLYSEQTLIEGESEADLVAFGRRLRATLSPMGELELMLADKIVTTAWRLRRVTRIEAQMFDRRETPAQAFTDYHAAEKMLSLGRYEAGLERAMYRALHELQRLQAARGEDVPTAATVDVSVSWAPDDDSPAPLTVGSFLQDQPEIKEIKHAE